MVYVHGNETGCEWDKTSGEFKLSMSKVAKTAIRHLLGKPQFPGCHCARSCLSNKWLWLNLQSIFENIKQAKEIIKFCHMFLFVQYQSKLISWYKPILANFDHFIFCLIYVYSIQIFSTDNEFVKFETCFKIEKFVKNWNTCLKLQIFDLNINISVKSETLVLNFKCS